MPTPRDFVKHDLTQCRHGQLARQCLLCEQAAEIEQTWAALEGVTLHRNAPLKAEPVCQCKAEIERLTQRNDELRTANGFAELEAEIERLRTEVGRVKYSERMHAEALDTATQGYERLRAEIKQLQTEIKALREVIISAAHTLEQARIWGGGTWHWNINATACQRAWKILDAALAAKEDI